MIWQAYEEDITVWAVSSYENQQTLLNFRNQLGLTFPVLVDEHGTIYEAYRQQAEFYLASYPQDWLIDADGVVAYAENEYKPDAVRAAIERALEE
jgi:peroxiredoxin